LGSITQLTIVSLSPTGGGTVVKNGAGLIASRRESKRSTACSKAANQGGCVLLQYASITQLAIGPITPTGDSTVVKNGAGVVVSRRESDRCATRSKAAGQGGGRFG